MSINLEDDEKIRSYLLGGLAPEDVQSFEEHMLRDDDAVARVQLVEDELIEDYARGALQPRDRERFAEQFLSSPRRRRKLAVVMGIRQYARAAGVEREPARAARPPLWGRLFAPRWKIAAFAALALAVGAGAWQVFSPPSQVERGLVALNRAYSEQRPLESRATGLSYAPFSETRGDAPAKVDPRARDLSAALLLGAADADPSPAALHARGLFYLTQRELDKSIEEFEEALKSDPDSPRLHSDLGAALYEKGKLERAADQSGRAETIFASSLTRLNRALQLNDSLPEARFNRALLYQQLRLPRQAREDWEKYLSQDQTSPWAAEARQNLKRLAEQSDKESRRERDLYGSLLASRRAGDEEEVWRVFSRGHLRTGNVVVGTLADSYLAAAATAGREGEAAELLRTLSDLGRLSARKSGDNFTSDFAAVYGSTPRGRLAELARARSLTAAAYGAYNGSDNQRAIELYGQAKSLFAALGDEPEALLAEFWLAHCHYQQRDKERRFPDFTAVVARSEAAGYVWLQAIALTGLANAQTRAAQYSLAVEHSWQAYKLSQRIGDENGKLRSLSSLAGLYCNLGNYHQSIRLAQQGFDLSARILADASQVIGLYAMFAWNFNALGYYDAALEYEKEAVRLGEAMNNPLALSRYHVQTGLIHGKLNDHGAAIHSIRRGLEIARGVASEKSRREMITYASLFLARALRESGALADALADLDRVIRDGREHDELWLVHQAGKEKLLTHIAAGEAELAGEELRRVLDAYEVQRQQIYEEGNRNTFFSKEQDIYDIAIDFVSSRPGGATQSFEYSETSRARSLLDASTAGWREADGAGTPDLRFSGSLPPMPLDEIMRGLPAGAQLLQYAVLKDRVVIWYVSRGRFESFSVGVGSDELAGKVDRLSRLVSGPPGGDDQLYRKAAAELYDLLIRPAEHLLDGGKRICVVPDKALNLLPFNALFSRATGKHLVESFAVLYAPSATLFIHNTAAATRKGADAGERLLSVGNPAHDREAFAGLADLPDAAEEAAEIADFYPSHSLLVGRQASKSSVLAEMRRADVIHLATHYVPEASAPMLSRLPLAPGVGQPRGSAGGPPESALQAYEIYRLRPARARLVVLSACRTGAATYFKGEGGIGFSRPFQAAGVPLVVASLWPVDSRATADLMIAFHRLRTLKGLPTVEALRQAQLGMLHGGGAQYRHPYYWASFAVTGGDTDF